MRKMEIVDGAELEGNIFDQGVGKHREKLTRSSSHFATPESPEYTCPGQFDFSSGCKVILDSGRSQTLTPGRSSMPSCTTTRPTNRTACAPGGGRQSVRSGVALSIQYCPSIRASGKRREGRDYAEDLAATMLATASSASISDPNVTTTSARKCGSCRQDRADAQYHAVGTHRDAVSRVVTAAVFVNLPTTSSGAGKRKPKKTRISETETSRRFPTSLKKQRCGACAVSTWAGADLLTPGRIRGWGVNS